MQYCGHYIDGVHTDVLQCSEFPIWPSVDTGRKTNIPDSLQMAWSNASTLRRCLFSSGPYCVCGRS